MDDALSDVQVCDICERATCATCQPDAVSRCAGDGTIHCDTCASTCAACTIEAAREHYADLAMDIAREEWTANRKVAEGHV